MYECCNVSNIFWDICVFCELSVSPCLGAVIEKRFPEVQASTCTPNSEIFKCFLITLLVNYKQGQCDHTILPFFKDNVLGLFRL